MRHSCERRANVAMYSQLLRRIAIRSLFSGNSFANRSCDNSSAYSNAVNCDISVVSSFCQAVDMPPKGKGKVKRNANRKPSASPVRQETLAARRHAATFTMLAWSSSIRPPSSTSFWISSCRSSMIFDRILCDLEEALYISAKIRNSFANYECDSFATAMRHSQERRATVSYTHLTLPTNREV